MSSKPQDDTDTDLDSVEHNSNGSKSGPPSIENAASGPNGDYKPHSNVHTWKTNPNMPNMYSYQINGLNALQYNLSYVESTPSNLHLQDENIIPIFFSPQFLQQSSFLQLGGYNNVFDDEIGTPYPSTSLHVIEERDESSLNEGVKYSVQNDFLESEQMQSLETPRSREVPAKRRCTRINPPECEYDMKKRVAKCRSWSEINKRASSEGSVRKTKSSIKQDSCTQTSHRMLSDGAHEEESLKLNLENLSISSASSKRSVYLGRTQLDNKFSVSGNHNSDPNYLHSRSNFGVAHANAVASKTNDLRISNLKIPDFKTSDFKPRELSTMSSRTSTFQSTNVRENPSTVNDFANTSLPSSVPEEVPLKHVEPKIIILKTKPKQRRKKRLKRKFNVIDVQSDSDSCDVVTYSATKKNQGDGSQAYLENVKRLSERNSRSKISDLSPSFVSNNQNNRNKSCDLKNIARRNNFMREDYSKTELEERELRTIYPDESQHDLEAPEDFTSLLSEYVQGITATKSFATDFKDVCETKSVTDLYKEIGFKKRASEMLRISSTFSETKDLNGRRKQGEECNETCELSSRNDQCLDVDYYLLSSDSCSDEENYCDPGALPVKNIRVSSKKSKHKLCFCLPL